MHQRAGKQQAGRLTSPPYGLDGDPAAVVFVQHIFTEFCRPYAHATLSEIARDLNVDEVPTQRGGRWYAGTVRYILRNPEYVRGGVISQETYDRAQRRLTTMRPGPPRD